MDPQMVRLAGMTPLRLTTHAEELVRQSEHFDLLPGLWIVVLTGLLMILLIACWEAWRDLHS